MNWHLKDIIHTKKTDQITSHSELIFKKFERANPYQNINLITDCQSGLMYLVGTHGRSSFMASQWDWIDLYQVLERPDGRMWLHKVAEKNVQCDSCDMTASGNVHVTVDGGLEIISSTKTPHLDPLTNHLVVPFQRFSSF